ncbi:uncharacterized membrane protein HdeD (DUF308 family) [Allocatelliglobosispora scoriae]|uniref:Uncharacterized membrane protein HdeD (DUF308 family) n=1 Tax=Allocatelliglobosispora scoriae TaxID=643052 RepID=A0A841BYM7_9ACTN|nr:DUF308 domain-containing protein [Allocatelliglobosispora scoriae]MBB5871820.1 uncharacterized membrane protein HdeD (DUF308 family) [Allocatelliglobosispora scoriae]
MADIYRDADLETTALAAWRKMALVGGITSIALGLVLLIWPEQTLLVIAALFGIWLVILGVTRLAGAATDRDNGTGARVLEGVLGLALVILGIVCLAHLIGSLKALAVLIGLIWIFAGLVEIASVFTRRMGGWQRVGTFVFGAVSIVGGLVVLLWPKLSLTTLVWLTGLWLIMLGVVQLILAWRASSAQRPIAAR